MPFPWPLTNHCNKKQYITLTQQSNISSNESIARYFLSTASSDINHLFAIHRRRLAGLADGLERNWPSYTTKRNNKHEVRAAIQYIALTIHPSICARVQIPEVETKAENSLENLWDLISLWGTHTPHHTYNEWRHEEVGHLSNLPGSCTGRYMAANGGPCLISVCWWG